MHKIQGVYLVAGLRFHPTAESYLKAAEAAFQGGVKIFQLRAKDELSDSDHLKLSKQVRELTRQYQVTYFVNDNPEIAKLSDADGVHLGPDDMPVAEARKIVGPNCLIGRSSHSYEEAIVGLDSGADYLAVGPIHQTDCKAVPNKVVGLELLERVLKKAKIPVVAIGGINHDNLASVAQTGVPCFGLIRGIMAAQDIEAEARQYVQSFSKYQKEKL